MHDIPFGGYSTPIAFSVDYAPDVSVEILLSFRSDYAGIELSTKSVIFSSGTNTNYFYIYYSNTLLAEEQDLTVGYVDVSMVGVNKQIYSLPDSSFSFNLIEEDTSRPTIVELIETESTQTNTTIFLSVSEISVAYYMIALDGTEQPEFDEVKSQGPATYETTQSKYGTLYIGGDQQASFTIDGLDAETSYILYVFLEDRGYNEIKNPSYITITTENRYNAANLDIKFLQNYLNSAERELALEYVAFILCLPTDKVIEQEYDFDRRRRLSSNDEAYTYLSFHVLATPDSEVYPSPLKLAKQLNEDDSKEYLEGKLSTYDSSYQIEPEEFERYIPVFSSTIDLVEVTETTATIKAKLDSYGWIFAVAIKKSEDLGTPTPYQIEKGYNFVNVEAPSASVEVSEKFEYFSFSFSGLDYDTEYTAYIVGGSAHPGYPDLMDSEDIESLDFTTPEPTVDPTLDINGQEIREISCWGLFLLGVFFLIEQRV